MQQEGQLCAQHCLNSLLQGAYYTAVDLADIARQLDRDERAAGGGGGDGDGSADASAAGRGRGGEAASANMDDTGFFSVQVIARAIAVWGLELVNFNSSAETATAARRDPVAQSAFICNFREHWLTIRRLGSQWFNLNSLLTGPELISDTYLSLTLAQLQRDGYSIYLVVGDLPDCQADQLLRLAPVVQNVRPRLIGEDEAGSGGEAGGSRPRQQQEQGGDDADLERAIALSIQEMSG